MNDDPRLTAYALGELETEAREAFERELLVSETLQHDLAETSAVCATLTPPPAEAVLTEARRSELRARIRQNLRAARRQSLVRRAALIGGAAAAAAAIVVVVSWPGVPVEISPPQNVAEATPQQPNTSTAPPEQITRLLAEGERFAETGRFDLAGKRAEQVLDIDRYNIAARRQLEQIEKARESVGTFAQNESRARLVSEVDLGWQLQATGISDEATTSAERPYRRAGREAPVVSEPSNLQSSLDLRSDTPLVAGARAAGGVISGTSLFGSIDEIAFAPSQTANFESYADISENGFHVTLDEPLSTFSIDVDTASYANVRRFLTDGQLPPTGAVRVEELINYFPFTLPAPTGDQPFSVTTDVARAPWADDHLIARIALKGREIATNDLPPSNLVFLIDVSGSMRSDDKLSLLQKSLTALVENLATSDRVAIVTYAGNSGLALQSTSCEDKKKILAAVNGLTAGGSTNGSGGIALAYRTAREHFLKTGNNRVILCTDGDFNVGITDHNELIQLIENERKSGVFLSVLGFGTGNLKDSTMEQLADKGNGNYAYIDSLFEGRKVLVEQMTGTLFTIAKDVKIQVEFNPVTVAGYRLIGYENRLLAKEDFNNDKKDAGEIGAGHNVTALYEIVPAGQEVPGRSSVDPLKYQTPPPTKQSPVATSGSRDLFTVKLRFKEPTGDTSELIETTVQPGEKTLTDSAPDFRFAVSVAAFGMKLRGSEDLADFSWAEIQSLARASLGDDPSSIRAEFLTLIEKARHMSADPDAER